MAFRPTRKMFVGVSAAAEYAGRLGMHTLRRNRKRPPEQKLSVSRAIIPHLLMHQEYADFILTDRARKRKTVADDPRSRPNTIQSKLLLKAMFHYQHKGRKPKRGNPHRRR